MYLTYEFGCLPPNEGQAHALEQMQRRVDLWNALVDVERAQLPEIERRAAVKKAQAESGLYWCNYDDVINSYQRARKRTGRGAELKSRRWNGSGKVAVRYQTGLPADAAFGRGTRLQIEPVEPSASNV